MPDPYAATPVPVEGLFEAVFDDDAGTVAVTGPDDTSGGRGYTAVEREQRAAQLRAKTLRVKRPTGEDGLEVTTNVTGGTEEEGDIFALYPHAGSTPGVLLSGNGNAAFSGEVTTGGAIIGGVDVVDRFNSAPRGILAHYWASGNSVASWGSGFMGLVRFQWANQPGRRYRLGVRLNLQGTAGDKYQIALRHTTGTTPPTVVSSSVHWAYGTIGANSEVRNANETFHTADHTFIIDYPLELPYNVLVTIRNWSANREMRIIPSPGNSQSHFWLEDIGLNNSGTIAVVDAAGGTPFGGGSPPAPTPQPVTRTGTWQATGFRSWRGGAQVSDDLHHGTYGGIKRVSQVVFDWSSITEALAGATINWARIRLRNVHTHNSTGAVIRLNVSSHNTLQASPPASAGTYVQRTIAQYDNNWYVLSPIFTASTRSVWLGIDAGSGLDAYAKFARYAKDAVLEVNYTK